MSDKRDAQLSGQLPSQVWVIDTSSVIWVKDKFGKVAAKGVYAKLLLLVNSGGVLFPKQVLEELEHPKAREDDPCVPWARKCAPLATRRPPSLMTVREVLRDAPEMLDHNKPTGVDEADPYVVALALDLMRAGHEVTVVTDDRRDRDDKMSMSTACGILRLVSLPMGQFLKAHGLWKP